jgi:hypothetical protein
MEKKCCFHERFISTTQQWQRTVVDASGEAAALESINIGGRRRERSGEEGII